MSKSRINSPPAGSKIATTRTQAVRQYMIISPKITRHHVRDWPCRRSRHSLPSTSPSKFGDELGATTRSFYHVRTPFLFSFSVKIQKSRIQRNPERLAGWLPSASNPANGPWKLRQCPKSQQILTIPATAKRVWPKIDKVCSRNIQMHAGTSIFRDYRKQDGRRHKYIHWGVQKPRRLTAARKDSAVVLSPCVRPSLVYNNDAGPCSAAL